MVDERRLIARVRAGDPAAERALYEAHVDRVYGLAYRIARDEHLAEEFTQEAFIRAFDRLGGFRGDSSFWTWMYRITVTVVYNGLRKLNRRRARQRDLSVVEGVGRRDREPRPYLRERLERAIESLPPGYRTVFVMHEVEGYTHEEIADALGVEVGTSKAQLSRARARLREQLSDVYEGRVS